MNKKTIFILMGVPCSGKSFVANEMREEFPDAVYLNADTLRKVMTGDISDQSQNNLVFRVFDYMLEYFMLLEKDIIIDNCNVKKSYRKKYIEAAKENGYEVLGIVLDTPLEICLERNEKRERKVPQEVIEKFDFMLRQNFPSKEEGFDNLDIIESRKKK